MSDTLPTIEEIKDEIRAGLELAEKATPGPWKDHPETLQNGSLFNSINGAESFVAHLCSTNYVHEDASFIATSRTLCPAQGRALLAAVDMLDYLPNHLADEMELRIRREWKGGAR